MTAKTLAEKLGLKPGARAAVVGAPHGYVKELGRLPKGTVLVTRLSGTFDWIQLFVKNRRELEARAPAVVKALGPQGLIWIAFPKGSSKIQTDLTRDQGWEALARFDLKWTNLVSVNDTWSAFSLRRYRPGEARQSFR